MADELEDNTTNAQAINFTMEPVIDEVTMTSMPEKILIGRPKRHTYVRVHPLYRGQVRMFVNTTDIEKVYYLFGSAYEKQALEDPAVVDEMRSHILYLACERKTNQLRIWPVRCELDAWALSELEAVKSAMKVWTRIVPAGSSFRHLIAEDKRTEPVWPKEDFRALVARAFGTEFIINNADHPVIRQTLHGAE